MPSSRRRVLARTLVLWILAFSGFVTLLTTGLQLFVEYRADTSALDERLEMVERTTVPSVAEGLWDVDLHHVQVQLDGIVQLDDVTSARLEPLYGRTMEAGGEVEEGEVIRRWPVVFGSRDERMGTLEVRATLAHIKARVRGRVLMILVSQAFKTLAVTAFILALFHNKVTRHLETMAGYASRLRADQLDAALELSREDGEGDDELEVVVSAVNTMRENLRREISALHDARHAARRFVPSAFLRLLGHDQVAETRRGDTTAIELTLLFADIRGFTSIAEQLDADAVFAFINRHLARIEPLVIDEGGFINEYRGDGILALFVDPAGAVRAGQRIVEAVQAAHDPLGDLDVSVGIHTGRLMLGVIGGDRQLSASVVGDAVNLASRVESLTRRYGASLLLTDATRDRLEHPERWPMRPVDRVAVKGREASIDLWETTPDRAIEPIARFTTAVDHYRAGRFDLAGPAFSKLALEDPTDILYALYVERCSDAPDPDFDGVARLTRK